MQGIVDSGSQVIDIGIVGKKIKENKKREENKSLRCMLNRNLQRMKLC